jgi:predicted nucleotidyltransferase
MTKIIQENRNNLIRLCTKYKVKSLEIFGSVISEDSFNFAESDIDFIVKFLPLDPIHHAKNYFSLLRDLKNLFKKSIDLVEAGAIKNPYFLESINKSRQSIYEA